MQRTWGGGIVLVLVLGCGSAEIVERRLPHTGVAPETPLVVSGEHVVYGSSVYSILDEQLVGSLPLTISRPNAMVVDGSRLYVGDDRIEVFDISEPTAPVLLGTKERDGMFRQNVADLEIGPNGDLWVLNGVEAVPMDATDPENLVSRGVHMVRANRIQIVGSFLYGINGEGLRIFDISSGTPEMVAMPIENRAGQGAWASFHVRGDTLAVTLDGQLTFFDVSDPRSPEEIGARAAGGDNVAHIHVWNETLTFATHHDWGIEAHLTGSGDETRLADFGPGPPMAMASTERFLVRGSGSPAATPGSATLTVLEWVP